MSLKHLGISVADLPASRDFLTRFFDLRQTHATDALCLLEDDAGFVLTLLQAPAASAPAYPKQFHLGFYVDEAEVRARHARLTAAGIEASEIRAIHGGLKFYVHDPGDILIEVCTPDAG